MVLVCTSLGVHSLSEEFAEGKLADGGRDRVMWTKGGVLWKINVVIEEKRVGEREIDRN